MFKSVFTKYISAFILILFVSFIILATVLCSTVNNYAQDEKSDSIIKVAETVLGFMYSRDGNGRDSLSVGNFNDYIKDNRETLLGVIYALDAYTEDIDAFITDASGNVLLHNEHIINEDDIDPNINKIPQKIIDSVTKQGSYSGTDLLSANGNTKYLVYALPIRNYTNPACGVLFVCTSDFSLPELNRSMINTVIMSCLWILLATMIAVYFISERITSPLKYMNRAAKSFANGHFDVRVPVTGRDEISELAVAFNSMATSLSNSDELRRSFLANVSHDLRTPMTTISGFIDGIIDGTIPPDKHEYYLDVIRTEVRRLSRLVSSLLDITRIQAGERKFTKSAFDICEMARIIIIGFEQKIEEKKLDIEFICDNDKMFAWADRDAIYQILYNICDNAVKFSSNGAKYRVTITEKNKKILTSVYNEGQGIKEDELPFVFERFYKGDKSRGLDKTGVGLGMYIAKTIIDAHEETISVRSEYGKYCEFTFSLPYIREAEISKKNK
ncbi:MAG: HAMP domain-containing protein [Clostridia bacterium]|nr:HAMP domain-containing protein [Clostridia bacterium]